MFKTASATEIFRSEDAADSATELVFELVQEWYGLLTPSMHSFSALNGDKFEVIWTTLWFAKGALQAPLDLRLKKYAALFSVDPAATRPPALSRDLALLWDVSWMILYDQVSRNVFRGSPGAYATDAAARSIASSLLPSWDRLPTAIRVSVALVYIHSEDMVDFHMLHDDLLPRLRTDASSACPFVWASLNAIATNHGDRMRAFGRVPERNAILGRVSTEAELTWMASTKPV
jgi:uncharacterized protein (DUF924 family)